MELSAYRTEGEICQWHLTNLEQPRCYAGPRGEQGHAETFEFRSLCESYSSLSVRSPGVPMAREWTVGLFGFTSNEGFDEDDSVHL